MNTRWNIFAGVAVLAVLVAAPVSAGTRGTQHDDGIVGMTRKNGNGCACHNLASTPSVQVWISGPTIVRAGSASLYTVNIVGGPAISGGFNVAAGTGALFASSGEEQLIAGELTHTAPKAFLNDSVHWTFVYRAPFTQGHDTLYAVGQSVNGNGLPDNGDQWNFAGNFPVAVVSSSAPLPSLTEWGIALLILGFLIGGRQMLSRRMRSTA